MMKRYTIIFTSALIFVILVAGYLSFAPGRAERLSQPELQQTESTKRTVQVSGTGELKVQPDSAVVRLGVQTEADTAQAALRQNNTQMQTLMNALEESDIPSDNIQTQTIRLSPRYEFDNNSDSRNLVGYTASNVLEVRTENLSTLGSLLDESVKAGANTIESINFEISATEDLTDQAREAAVQNARHKAEELAALTGATLGPVLEIRETSSPPVPAAQPVEPMAEAAAVPISPGSQSVRVDLQVTWTLLTGNQ